MALPFTEDRFDAVVMALVITWSPIQPSCGRNGASRGPRCDRRDLRVGFRGRPISGGTDRGSVEGAGHRPTTHA